jgi:acetolactate synthase small subunit
MLYFRFSGSELRVEVQGARSQVSGTEFRFSVVDIQVQNFGVEVQGARTQVSGT